MTKVRGLSVLCLAAACMAGPVARASEVANPLFAYTHLLPSPFTVPAGRLSYGTDVALGVTDFFQVGSGILRDAYRFYNVNAKLALVDYPEFALALTGSYEFYNYHDISPDNPDLKVTAWQPGIVTAFELFPRFAMFVGGNVDISNANLVTNGIQTSGYTHGAQVESDISWAYNPPSKKKHYGNVLSAGATYDLTYKIYGIGLSHHWPGFHLGIHYYPNADQYRVLPIIAGGGAIDL